MTLAEFLKMTERYPRDAEMVMPDMLPIEWTATGIDHTGKLVLIVSDRKPVTDGADDEE